MATVRPHALTHPARPEHMAGQVMRPVRFLYAKAFTTQGPCVHQCRGPPSCFFNTLPTHPQVPGATAGYRLQPAPELHPASTGSGPLHAGGTTPPSNSLRGQQLPLLRDYTSTAPGDDRRLQQKIALTTRRTTASTAVITLTSYKDNISGYRSMPQFSTELPQLATTPGGGIGGSEIRILGTAMGST
jgi:hypothetical protein